MTRPLARVLKLIRPLTRRVLARMEPKMETEDLVGIAQRIAKRSERKFGRHSRETATAKGIVERYLHRDRPK